MLVKVNAWEVKKNYIIIQQLLIGTTNNNFLPVSLPTLIVS